MSQILPRLSGAAVNAFRTPTAMSFTYSSRTVSSISNSNATATTTTTAQPQAFSKEYSTHNTPSTQTEGFELASTLDKLNTLFDQCEGSWPVGVYWYTADQKDGQLPKASE